MEIHMYIHAIYSFIASHIFGINLLPYFFTVAILKSVLLFTWLS